jgi:hypothetical protein
MEPVWKTSGRKTGRGLNQERETSSREAATLPPSSL